MTNRPFPWRTLVVGQIALSLLAITTVVQMPTRLVWNASASVPIGLYAIHPVDRLALSELVLAQPPAPIAEFLADGGYVGNGVPLLKRIAALPGQTVCREGFAVTVDGAALVMAREHDRAGRPLPHWSGRRLIAEGEVFLVNRDEPASLDGRYFGPLPTNSIVGRATPVWTDEER